ncbi:MAG TPA: chromosomal replication initiator protein DnaA, partial [Gammaproteobacteria bacterium]|nr:chromosomal replication initiator protein DnaA [Gammaproteobacteria bacterium]
MWDSCLNKLQERLSSQEFNTWIRPLQMIEESETRVTLLAPNRFVLDWVNDKYHADIKAVLATLAQPQTELLIRVGTAANATKRPHSAANGRKTKPKPASSGKTKSSFAAAGAALDRNLSFENFIEGKSNQLCRAAAIQVSNNEDTVYNPLLIYGGVGLGKTHLMHACGLRIKQHQPDKKVIYLHAERFVADMVSSLQHNRMALFK